MTRHTKWVVIVFAGTALSTLQAQTSGDVTNSSASTGATQKTVLPIKARSHDEYVAYQAAMANKQNAEAIEKSAAEFAAKFPDSDIRLLLYRAVMNSYRAAGDQQKMMDAALKVLELDK